MPSQNEHNYLLFTQ